MAKLSRLEAAGRVRAAFLQWSDRARGVEPLMRAIKALGSPRLSPTPRIGSLLRHGQPVDEAGRPSTPSKASKAEPDNTLRALSFAGALGANGSLSSFGKMTAALARPLQLTASRKAISHMEATSGSLTATDRIASRLNPSVSISDRGRAALSAHGMIELADNSFQSWGAASNAGKEASAPSLAFAKRLTIDSPHQRVTWGRRLETLSLADLARANDRATVAESSAPAITLNSSPTVVVNGAQDAADLEHRIAIALRRHREELFDQLKREAARRERTCF